MQKIVPCFGSSTDPPSFESGQPFCIFPPTIRWLARMYKVRRLSHPKFVLQKCSTGFWTVSETHLPLYKLVGFVLFSKSDWKSAVGVEVCVIEVG